MSNEKQSIILHYQIKTNQMTHFKIIYKVGNLILVTENRTHETEAIPSVRMVTNCLHSILLDKKIEKKYWSDAKGELYRNNSYLSSYRLSDTPK